jgi:hypothetical protein
VIKPKEEMLKEILVVLGGKKDKEPEEHSVPKAYDEVEDEGLEASADEIIEAIKMRDARALVRALKTFLTQCEVQ